MQDDGVQNTWDYGGGVEQDLHRYSSKITEGKDNGKYRCNLCGTDVNISPKAGTRVPAYFFCFRAVIFKSGVSCRNIGQEQLPV